MNKGILYFLIFTPISIFGQISFVKDTLQFEGDSVVVSATRSERKLSNVTVPVTIINAKTIQQTGSLRLSDILKEQPGITMTSGFGAGVQLQGLNPDYTIILINGEPLVGRTAGVLDLNRIALGNIKKIEIVKGPSSSLYGSEAMAGVINIITDVSSQIPIHASLRYGSYETTDASMNHSMSSPTVFYNGFYNDYRTNGYSIRPSSTSSVKTPITRFATHQQIKYNLTDKTNISVGLRYTKEQIKNEISVINGGVTIQSHGKETIDDYNMSTTINHRFSSFLKTSIRGYLTQYNSNQHLLTISGAPYNDLMNHLLNRIENQTEWVVNKSLTTIMGGGMVMEGVKSSRYDSDTIRKTNSIQYAFSQLEWIPNQKLILIAGLRFDKNQTYASAWSPKISLLYKLNKTNKIKLSVGQGFKSPDFRQLYLDFTNAAAGGYSVFGTAQAQKVIGQLESLGQIGILYDNYFQLKALKPEYSNGLHLSWEFEPTPKSFFSIQFFRNDIRNLIEVQQVGAYLTGAQIYSYLNIGRAFTTGFETEVKHQISNALWLSGAYQFVKTGDRDQIAQIKQGTIYTRNEQGLSRQLNLKEYVGLPNNSKHKAQFKFNYSHLSGIFANFRALYRSDWVVVNTNGNEVFDKGDQFAKGYISLHLSMGKKFNNGFEFQWGSDNLLNYIDATYLPNLPGRSFYATIKYQIKPKK